MLMRRGSEVVTPEGRGVVTDRIKDAGEWLVRLDNGTELDRAHGRWYEDCDVAPTGGFRPNVRVWWANTWITAGEVLEREALAAPRRVSLAKRYVDDYFRFLAEDPIPEWELSRRRGAYPVHGFDVLLDRNDCEALADWFGGRRG